ncbi:tripartite motif containing 39 L homeolog isoform X2, partial [Paramuricea clavata]
MASASSESVPVDEINELLTCCMCLETLQEPRSLACFHNFCKVCLGKNWAILKVNAMCRTTL